MELLTPFSQYIVSTYSDVIHGSFGRHEITPAAYIGFLAVTTVTLALGFHRQDYVGYARARHQGL